MSFGRRLTLDVGGFRIRHAGPRDLRVAFAVERDKSRDPNAAVVQVWNLAPETRAELIEKPRLFCKLSAGYADEGEHVIFVGVLLHVESRRDGASNVTEMHMGDESEQRTALQRIHRTFPAGTPVATVLRELVKATGLEQGNTAAASIEARIAGSLGLPRPYTASGQALSELNAFARALGFDWTIQDRKVFFTGLSSGVLGTGPVLRADTGLEENPTVDGEGRVSVLTWMIPDLLPGHPFSIQSETLRGLYVADTTRHFGDTHGADWSVAIEGVPFEQFISRGLKVNE